MRLTIRFCPALVALIAILFCWPSPAAIAQASARPGDTGTTVGAIREVDSDFLLIAAPAQMPLRFYYKPAGSAAALRSPAASFKPGDWVAIRWSNDGRLRIESAESAAPPASPLPQAAALPLATPSQSAASPPTLADERALAPVTTGEKVNGAIDNFLETGKRLLELPLFMLLGAVGLLGGLTALAIAHFSARRAAASPGRIRLVRALWATEAVLLLLTAAYLLDRKIAGLQNQLNELRRQNTHNAIALLGSADTRPARSAVAPAPATPEKRESFFFDATDAQRQLTQTLGSLSAVTLNPAIYDPATDLVQIHADYPLIQAYLAIISLRHPSLQIKLGGNLSAKTLTSDFARENNCTLAINGEAGLSPAPGSGLGTWRGYLVSLGHVLQREDPSIPRPFLSFDRQNHATFTAAAAPDRALASDGYNVLWGRLDALVNGTVQTADERNRQPRTAMGINQDGSRLYLLVVDGRQPNYSMGATRAEVGFILKAFGACNGMLCDEGGSSCMYLQQIGRVLNIPSDNQGQERPTYTHFGIALRTGS